MLFSNTYLFHLSFQSVKETFNRAPKVDSEKLSILVLTAEPQDTHRKSTTEFARIWKLTAEAEPWTRTRFEVGC